MYERVIQEQAMKRSLPVLNGVAEALMNFDVDFDPDEATAVTDDMVTSESSTISSMLSDLSDVPQLDGLNSPRKKRKANDRPATSKSARDMKERKVEGKSNPKRDCRVNVDNGTTEDIDLNNSTQTSRNDTPNTVAENKEKPAKSARKDVHMYRPPNVHDSNFNTLVSSVVARLKERVDVTSQPGDENFNPVRVIEVNMMH